MKKLLSLSINGKKFYKEYYYLKPESEKAAGKKSGRLKVGCGVV